MNLRQQLEAFEGRRNQAYPDPITHAEPWTIGVGHVGPEVHAGLVWTDAQIDTALERDIIEALNQCRDHFPWFDTLNEPRQAVLAGMAFQMGITRLLGFHRVLEAARDGNYATAAAEMRRSNWAHQTPKRAVRLAAQMETGSWA